MARASPDTFSESVLQVENFYNLFFVFPLLLGLVKKRKILEEESIRTQCSCCEDNIKAIQKLRITLPLIFGSFLKIFHLSHKSNMKM